ncbi:MAG TPA: hypothetical protein VFT29_20890, partial [Gemmatimonadaceae bacterium]|nr:hypothetical protein [Gemmatimonadaceae bacterium]
MAAAARRVVVDVRMLGDGGIGTYLNEVVPRVIGLRPNWHFTLLGDPDALTAASWMRRDVRRTNISIVPATSHIYTIAEQLELLWRSPRDADLFWAPHYNVPLLANVPLVVTIHDVCHLALPEAMGSWPRRMYARHVYGVIRRRARGLLFDSEFSRAEMSRLVGESAAPAAVAPLAADAWLGLQHNGDRPMGDPYLLYVGNAKRHKNVPALLEAFRRVADRVPHRLVLLGRHTGLRADPAIADAL